MTDSDNAVCNQCGAPLGGHLREGLCSRCLARFSLLEADDDTATTDDGGQNTEDGGLRPGDAALPPASKGRFGDYELLEEIAHGGMGVVYRARQISLKRIVAVKMLLCGQFAGKKALDRFRAEAETVARLQHPHIVAVHEIGETDGQPYFSMDFVAGRNLADLVRDRPLPARQAAGYVRKIAQAVHYAHTQGVLHRDLKPANVLIDEFDEPRITDFGLARQLTGDSELTLTGQILGSPNFMPPEQGAGNRARIGPARDIYGLGALLYYLLTARPPFVAETFEATLSQVLNTEPAAPSQLNPSIPGDLETLCLKCLEKDPARRYPTAAELADELGRWLNGEPIRARSIGAAGKTWRWCRRKPALAAMAAAVVTLLLTVTVVSVTAACRISKARKGEQREAYYSNIALANQYIEQGSIDRALETLWKCPEQYRHWEWGHLLYLCHQEAASFQAHATNVGAVIFSPDGRWVHSQDAAGVAKVWDWAAEREVFTFGSTSNRAGWISFDPQGEHLVAAMGTNGVSVWATTDWRELVTLRPQGGEVTTLAYSPDGQLLVTGGADGTVTVWGAANGQRLRELSTTNQPLRRVAISPDGQRLVAVADRTAWVWELPSGKVIRLFPDPSALGAADAIPSPRGEGQGEGKGDARAFMEPAEWTSNSTTPEREPASVLTSPVVAVFADDTGEHFAGIDSEGQLTLWRPGQAPKHLVTIRGSQPGSVRRVFFSPDGRWMVNAGDENTARVWDLATGTESLAISERVHQVMFSKDGRRMETQGAQNWVTTWDLTQGRKLKVLRGHWSVANAIGGLSPDGRLAASGDENGIVKIWSAGPGRELARNQFWSYAVRTSPDGRLMANCPWHEGVVIRSLRSGRELLRIHPPNESFMDAAFSPDSRRLVTVGTQKTAKVGDVETGELLLRLVGHRRQIGYGLAYSPDGRWIATGAYDGTAKVWDAHTGQEVRTFFMDPDRGYAMTGGWDVVSRLRFDDKGGRLITGGSYGKARIWDLATGRVVRSFDGGGLGVLAVFLPDQRHVLTSAATTRTTRLWEVSSGRLVAETRGRDNQWDLAVSTDGRRMFTASAEGVGWIVVGKGHGFLEVWDLEQSPRRVLDRSGSEPFLGVTLTPDDRTVACVSYDVRVDRWESFPWRQADYAEDGVQRSEVRDQQGQRDLAERVRAYARGYWRDRLQAELNGAEGEPNEPRVVEVPVDRSLFAKRDPRATDSQINLTALYTGVLGETFYGKIGSVEDHDDDLSELPVGLVTLGGVEFDIRGVIQLRRAEPLDKLAELAAGDDPVRVDGIPVEQAATRLHLLLGTIQPEADGAVIGSLVLHYADGETRALELVYGRDVREWWYDLAKGGMETTDQARVVWTGENPVAHEYGRRLRLYLNTRENPRPGVGITTLDFVSAMTHSAPFLIAVTLE